MPGNAPVSLPGWANWLAQDADGTWWGFEAEPNESDRGWYENEVGRYCRLSCRLSYRLDKEAPNPQWRQTLRKR